MGVGYKVNQLYHEAIHDVTSTEAKWKHICRLTGQIYRYEFDNILMVYMQRPGASLVADYDKWKENDRYVRRGSKGIAVFPSRALKPGITHVFDINDTGGRNVKLTWEFNQDNMESYAKFLQEKEGITEEDIPREKKSAKSFLQAFTENQIRVIINAEFGDRVTELANLAGTKRKMVEDSAGSINSGKGAGSTRDTVNGINETQGVTAEEILERSILYAVFTRCGFDIPPEKQDFSFITAFKTEEEVYRLGSLVSDISCEVLRSIAKDLKQMERRIAYDRGNINVSQGSGWNAVSGFGTAGRNHIHDEFREVRSPGNGVSAGESQGTVQDTDALRHTGREDAGSGGRSQPDDGTVGERLSEKESTRESELHNGDVEPKRTGEDAGGGNRYGGSGNEVPLTENFESRDENRRKQLEKEIDRELEEINSIGTGEIDSIETQAKGSFEQASFFGLRAMGAL